VSNLHRFVPITSGLVGPPSARFPWDFAARRVDALYLYLLCEANPELLNFNSKFQEEGIAMDTLDPYQPPHASVAEAQADPRPPKKLKLEVKRERDGDSFMSAFSSAVSEMAASSAASAAASAAASKAVAAASAPDPAVTAAQNSQLLMSLYQQLQAAQQQGITQAARFLQGSIEYEHVHDFILFDIGIKIPHNCKYISMLEFRLPTDVYSQESNKT
jgi:hypothetical protein